MVDGGRKDSELRLRRRGGLKRDYGKKSEQSVLILMAGCIYIDPFVCVCV